MNKILITGATGFVGSHALEALIQRDDVEPIAACRDRTRLLPEFRGEVREGDLMDSEYRQQVVQGVDADNGRAIDRLGYRPQHAWQEAVRVQMAEMGQRQHRPMKMYRPIA